jgi:mannosyltransferase OCH1-like enzyme
MIPRNLHFVWVGGAPMPDEYAQNIVGWTRLHPGWQVRVWDDDHVNWLRNWPEFEAARNPAQASDIVRYEALLLYGGIYLDCDVVPVRPLHDLLGHAAFAVDQGAGILCTAVLGAQGRHPAFREIVKALPAAFANGRTNLDQTGPHFQTPILRKHGITELPQETFFPYLWNEEPKPPTSATFGVHTWAKSWVPSAWSE